MTPNEKVYLKIQSRLYKLGIVVQKNDEFLFHYVTSSLFGPAVGLKAI